jgi:hypothetical protein
VPSSLNQVNVGTDETPAPPHTTVDAKTLPIALTVGAIMNFFAGQSTSPAIFHVRAESFQYYIVSENSILIDSIKLYKTMKK